VVSTAGYNQGYSDGEEWGFGDGFNAGWYENENTVVSKLADPIQKIEDYGMEKCAAEDSVSQIQYIDENIPKVYENGQKSEYDRFWDAYQDNGERESYAYCFSGGAWTPETFSPKWDIRPKTAPNMFNSASRLTGSMPELLSSLGVELDFSRCTEFNEFLKYSRIPEMGVIDTRSADTINYIFRYATSLETVQKLILRDDGSQTFGTYTFDRANVLKNIAVEGIIGDNCDIHFSPLSKESILGRVATEEQIAAGTNIVELNGVKYWGGIIAALKADASGKTLTLNKAAVNKAFSINVDDATTFPVDSEYHTLMHSKDNWKFSYI
jgi:hypothetical protein